jgi:hypothetical protein
MKTVMKSIVGVAAVLSLATASLFAQGGRGGAPAAAAPTGRASAPIDLTGYWVSMIVDEWRFRVSPQKGDIPYLPLNPEARKIAQAWDPAKDEASGNACKAYGAVGVMQRPGRMHITWDNDNTLKVDLDAGTQTRMFRFAAQSGAPGEATWQGNSAAQWDLPGGGGRRGAPAALPRNGSLRVVTTNMKPGYLRKNGVAYSEKAVQTEYFNRIVGAQGEIYLTVTAMVDDPVYLTQPFVRTYQFKQQPDATGWDPTPCLPR